MLTEAAQAQLCSCDALVMGGSAGAIDVLNRLLPVVPRAARIPLIVVVHLPPNRPSLLPDLFRGRCAARVAEPDDKVPVAAGTIWFAPSNYHLLIERDHSFSLSLDPPLRFSRPSIDVLFESAADAYTDRLCAIVLSGANDDGALGSKAVRRSGGLVIAQDPNDADSAPMPEATIARARPQIVATVTELAELIALATRAAP